VTKPDREARDEIVRELKALLANARKGKVVAFAALSHDEEIPKVTLVGDYEELFEALAEAEDLLGDGGEAEPVSVCRPS
jgi:hypothetical protein